MTIRAWAARLQLLARAAWLRFEIHETEAYLRDCARDGLIDSLHLRYWRDRVAALRVELALAESELT